LERSPLNSIKASALLIAISLLGFAAWQALPQLGAPGEGLVPRLGHLRTELARARENLLAGSDVLENPIPVPKGPVPLEFFGMHLIERANWPTIPVGALGKGTFTSWTYLQRSRGNYNWSNLDAWVALAQAQGVDYFFVFDGFPRWATSDAKTCVPANILGTEFCGALPSDPSIIDEFVTALVTRYRGRIKYYEIWNEPYAKPFVEPADLVAFANRVIPLIRSLDPDARIIAPSMNAPFGYHRYFERYYAAGGPTQVDIISLHAYADAPEKLTPGGDQLGPLLPMIAKYGISGKPFWDTEGAWNGTTGKDAPDAEHQPGFLARYFLLHWSEGFTRFYWYAWDNSLFGTLWNGRSGASKASVALKQVQSWMIGNTLAGRITPSGTVWSGTFARPDGTPTFVVWDTAGFSTFPAPPKYARYRDLEGEVRPIRDHQVPIGPSPVLLEP
jgi:hypothetical protein